MPSWVTPSRRRGVEILDDPATPADVRVRAMADLERANWWFGGTRSVRRALRDVLRRLGRDPLLLDVGTGTGDIPVAAARDAGDAQVALFTIGMDIAEDVARLARRRLSSAFVGSALGIPLADASVDVVTCSQVLHHFPDDDARRLVAQLHRVSRGWVVISDLRRSWLAAGGFWIASTLLRFHAVTRADGVTSVLRGFTARELAALVQDVTGVTPRIRRGVFWRLSATWEKNPRPGATDPRRGGDVQ
jgi:SAM-dependent methyltransferase